jgi:DNA-binding PadR family transcriptional regulator
MSHFHNHHHHRARFARHGHGWADMRRAAREFAHGDGRRRGRVFDQGDLRLVLLKLIAEKPRHGYELIKAVEEAVGGAYAPSPGVVYPTLTLLEDMGYARVKAEAEGGKKLYSVTPEGEAHLADQKAAVDALFARMAEVASANRGRSAPQIIRAMQNLNTALRYRLGRGPLSEVQVQAIAAALDAAARTVEDS